MNGFQPPEGAIAIVGLAGRFPKAKNTGEYWRNLRSGRECIDALTARQLLAAGADPKLIADPNYVKAGAALDNLEMFDAAFFGFSPRDAAIMDPQHRHFLECAWEALEDAGHPPSAFRGSIGVFAGSGMNAYMIYNLLTNAELMETAGLFLIRQTGNDKDVLATRVSYELDLRGPSVNIQTACSSSLVAVHMACQSLLNFESDMALAGGVTIEIPHCAGYLYREGEILSRDGHCRAFDANASGTVFGSGLGIVVLRRLEDALADGDSIRAIIRGSAINNDGSRKIGFLAPSVDGQAEVIAEALQVAGVDADSLSYVEAHGTGTRVGDPIEISGLTQAFRRTTSREGYCAIGSVKTNIGHLDSAAGVAGLIKIVLALENREIPPSLHFESPNPHIDFEHSPFFVNAELRPWVTTGGPRRAGVTSLGIGGTNAHVVLEEAPEVARARHSRPWHLLTLSAKSASALKLTAANLAAHIEQNPDLSLDDAAFTCQSGRTAFPYRQAVLCQNSADAVEGLRSLTAPPEPSASEDRPVVFLFSGQGSQHVNMGRELYETEPVFRDALDRCSELLKPHLELDLREILFPEESRAAEAGARLGETQFTQPALFAIEYALAQLWIAWGIRPGAMAGHSIGEYVAACIAGVFSLEDATRIVAARGRLMQSLAPGAMLAVTVAEEKARELLTAELSIAAVNGPDQCVISGPTDAIEALEQGLRAQQISSTRLHTSHAFHSAMMTPVLEDFRTVVGSAALHSPAVPYLSNVTGTWITPSEATDPSYWSRHLRETVRFSDSLTELFRDPKHILLEIGPGRTLCTLARLHPARPETVIALHSLPRPSDSASSPSKMMQTALGKIWAAGNPVDWKGYRAGFPGFRVPLPTYPFERKRYWIEPGGHSFGAAKPLSAPAGDLAKFDHWFYLPVWKETPLRPAGGNPRAESRPWLIFADGRLAGAIRRRLDKRGQPAILVLPGETFSRTGSGDYVINPASRADYDLLLAGLSADNNTPEHILLLWPLDAAPGAEHLGESETLAFFSLLHLAQSLGDKDWTSVKIGAVSDSGNLSCASLTGACRVISQEFAGMACRHFEISLPGTDRDTASLEALAAQVVEELLSGAGETRVAFRDSRRWTQELDPVTMEVGPTRLREHGVYLITGGLGAAATVVARRLARDFQAKLVLVGRTPVPSASEWDAALERLDAGDETSRKIRTLQELQRLGAEVLPLQADITNKEEMEAVRRAALERFGAVHGVIHAAGVLSDGPLQTKTDETAHRVLDAKVRGALVLDRVFGDSGLDFFLLFSSISAISPPAGQVDYAAANAFLDAFAQARNEQSKTWYLSVNWSRWLGVGMGAAGADSRRLQSERFGSETHWALNEHRLRGGACVFPGTGHLNMMVAARDQDTRGPLEMRDLLFSAPLALQPGEEREVSLLRRNENGRERFAVASQRTDDGSWLEYASGYLESGAPGPRPKLSIRAIRARSKGSEIDFSAQPTRQEKYFEFGPRWRCLKRMYRGTGEGLAELELPARYASDLKQNPLHPSLMDLATGCALYLIPNYTDADSVGVYFPMAYERLRVWDRLPARVYSHIRPRPGNSLYKDLAVFDVTISDHAGNVVAEVEGFSMRRVEDPTALTAATALDPPQQVANPPGGIAPEDGAEALLRLLSWTAEEAGVIVSGKPPVFTLAGQGAAVSRMVSGSEKGSWSEIERKIGGWWQELLGVDGVGLDQDFFDLGGQSLVAVRLVAKIKNTYQVELGLSTLFEARTIRQLAALVDRRRSGAAQDALRWSSLVCIKPGGDLHPIYFISGLRGNVLNFHTVARYLGPDRPVYALQPPGLDGKLPFLGSVEEVASHYINEIRSLQPHGPYHLAGYSFGGFVTFEMAQQLRRMGEEVGLAALIDSIEWHYWQEIKRTVSFPNRLRVYRERFHRAFLEPDGMAYLKDRFGARWRHGVSRVQAIFQGPPALAAKDIEDANIEAANNYYPKPYAGLLTLLRCSERSVLDGGDLLGWENLAAGGIDVHDLPGHHFNITQEPRVRVLGETLKACIEKSLAGGSGVMETARG